MCNGDHPLYNKQDTYYTYLQKLRGLKQEPI